MSSSQPPSPPSSRPKNQTATSARTRSPTRTTPGGASAPGKNAARCKPLLTANRTWASANAWTISATRQPSSTGSRPTRICQTGRQAGATSPPTGRWQNSPTHPAQIRLVPSRHRSTLLRVGAEPAHRPHRKGPPPAPSPVAPCVGAILAPGRPSMDSSLAIISIVAERLFGSTPITTAHRNPFCPCRHDVLGTRGRRYVELGKPLLSLSAHGSTQPAQAIKRANRVLQRLDILNRSYGPRTKLLNAKCF